jgi:hypothetical protein
MIVNTESSHLKYWYGEDCTQIWRLDNLETTAMSVGGCVRKPMNLKAELVRNARSMIKHYPDLTIFMSGGLDSEMALRSFLAAGITPKLVTVRFPDGNNMHDIGPMMLMLTSMGLKYSIIDIDPEEFYYSGEWKEIAVKYQAYTFYQQMLLKIAEQYNAPMLTVDEVELEKLPSINYESGQCHWEWSFLKKEDQDGVWRRFNDKTGIPALNNFYTYSPESILAFLKEDTVADLIRDQIPYKLSWTSSKMKIYGSLGYNFRQRPKWHGIENYTHLWDMVHYSIGQTGLNFDPRHYAVNALELEHNLELGKSTLCQVA